MNFGFPVISAATKRLIVLTAASAFLLAAGNVPQNDRVVGGPEMSDTVLAPITTADAAAAIQSDEATVAAAGSDDTRPASLDRLVSATMDGADDVVARDRELRCLATAVYFEARGEPQEGQLAVAQAILNRVASGRYADTVCGVISQPGQFSYDRSRAPRAGTDWEMAQAIAMIASDAKWREVAPRAMSFHAVSVSPNWRGKTIVAQIGRHIFYR